MHRAAAHVGGIACMAVVAGAKGGGGSVHMQRHNSRGSAGGGRRWQPVGEVWEER